MSEQNGRLVTASPKSVRDIAAAHPEVEFALVLARTINSVSSDPEQLRSAVYELARQKLQQLAHDDPSEKARLMNALEVAIAGVEAHTKNVKIEKFPVPSTTAYLQALNSDHDSMPRTIERAPSRVSADEVYASSPRATVWQSERRALRWLSSMALRYAVMLAFFGAIVAVILIQQRGVSLAQLRIASVTSWFGTRLGLKKPAVELSQAPQPAAAQPATADAKPERPLPTSYGVFAESGGKLYELQMLQGRAPDPRVAISAAITKPSQTVLSDGNLKFIVFRRQTKDDAADAIDVRVIAQVKQATTFDPSGKPVTASSDNVWVIRNILIPYRASPLKEDPQMYEVEPRDATEPLSPGRYALVLKGQVYDFTVDGTVTDKRHCLERLAAANGTFYSECPDGLTRGVGATAVAPAPVPRR